MLSTLRRNAFLGVVFLYVMVLIGLHNAGLFPRPNLYDVSRLIGGSSVTVEGCILDVPKTRWNQTRFLIYGRAEPLTAFEGRVSVTLKNAQWDLAPGDRVRLRGWLAETRLPTKPGGFNERHYLAGRRTFSRLTVWSDSGCELIEASSPWSWDRLAWRTGQAFRRYWESVLPELEAETLLGICVGGRGVLPPELKALCVRAGVYHIMVVSGQNVAVLTLAGLALLRLCRVPRRWLLAPCFLPLLFYASVVGGDPPVTRAVMMALVGLVAGALARDIPPWYPFGWGVGLLLALEPEALFGASFQLSFGATACLLWLFQSDVLLPREGASRWWRWCRDTGAASLAIFIALSPLLVFYFHRLSVMGLFANWSIFPMSSVVMMGGLLVGCWGLLSPGTVPGFLIQGVHLAIRLMLWVIEQLAAPDWACIDLPPPTLTFLVLYYTGLFGILWGIHRRKNREKASSLSTRRNRLQPG